MKTLGKRLAAYIAGLSPVFLLVLVILVSVAILVIGMNRAGTWFGWQTVGRDGNPLWLSSLGLACTLSICFCASKIEKLIVRKK